MKRFRITFLQDDRVIFTTYVETEFGFKNVISKGEDALKAAGFKKADFNTINMKREEAKKDANND